MIAPPGAIGPAGDSDLKVKNFRRTEMIGEQLALAAMRLLDNAEKIEAPRVSYAVQPFYTYLSNFGFRVLLVVDPATAGASLGHNPVPLYNCPLTGPKTAATCKSDGFASVTDPNLGTDFRVGDHLKSAVEYVRIGPVGMMFLPGEIPGELTVGLPAGFRSTPQNWYEGHQHAHLWRQLQGAGLRRAPHVRSIRVDDRPRQRPDWLLRPISNYRVLCVADVLVQEGLCAALHAAA